MSYSMEGTEDLAAPDEVERAVPIGEAIERRGERREVDGGTEQDPRSRNHV